MKKILITGSGGPLGVNITRSLKRAPENLFLLGTECNAYHIPLSLADRTEKIPHASDESKYVKKIKALENKYDIDLIFPTHPLEVRIIGRHRKSFKSKVFLPDQDTIETGNDKFTSNKIWEGKDVPVPRTYLITKENDLKVSFNELSKPVWVRASGTPGQGMGGKALLCENAQQAKAWIDYWKGWGSFVCCQYLPGDNMTWTSLWKSGRMIMSQGRQRLEYVLAHVSQSGITGAPAVSKTIKCKELNDIGEKATLALDEKPNGTYFVDCKKDRSGKLRVTEINVGRFGTTIHFYTEAGVNFPYYYVKLAFNEKIADMIKIDPVKENIYWIRTLDCGPVIIKGEDIEQ